MLLDLIEAGARAITRVAIALLGGALIALAVIASGERISAALTGGA